VLNRVAAAAFPVSCGNEGFSGAFALSIDVTARTRLPSTADLADQLDRKPTKSGIPKRFKHLSPASLASISLATGSNPATH